MLRVAITGGIAAGKSQVAAYLTEAGIPVGDADVWAREAVEPGRPAFRRIVEQFGASVVGGGGALNRGRLGERVFLDPRERAKLEAIVHPEVARLCSAWMDRQSSAVAAVVIPLLYETGAERDWDAVVCVACPASVQMARLRRRGHDTQQARARVAAQMPMVEKVGRADFVIMNHGSRALLREQTRRVLASILET